MEHLPSEHIPRELTEHTPVNAATREFMRQVQRARWDEVDVKPAWTEADFAAAEACFMEWPDTARAFGHDCRITTAGLERLAFDTRTPPHIAALMLDRLKARQIRRLRLRVLVAHGRTAYVPAEPPRFLV